MKRVKIKVLPDDGFNKVKDLDKNGFFSVKCEYGKHKPGDKRCENDAVGIYENPIKYMGKKTDKNAFCAIHNKPKFMKEHRDDFYEYVLGKPREQK
jgi:hypothetical protein